MANEAEAPGCGDGGAPLAEADADRLVEAATDDAVRAIQNALGVTTGDVAAQFFSGENGEALARILKAYIRCEEAWRFGPQAGGRA